VSGVKPWRRRGASITYYQQKAELPGIKAAMPEYADVNAQVSQDVAQRVDRAFQAFFRRIKAGQKPDYPRYKGSGRYNSVTSPQVGDHGGARLDNGFLVLAKLGRSAVRWSQPIAGTPKTVTVSREADGWYVCISCAEAPTQHVEPTGQETGMDVGLESFATLADGTMIHNPRCYRTAEAYLRRWQRRVARREKGSNRRRKAVKLPAGAHQAVPRKRQDFHHKAALSLVRQFDTVYYEDLRVRNMVQNHSLAKSISDAGWSAFLAILTFKAASAGKRVQAVNPAFTSQACSGCGRRVYKGLSVRWHRCPYDDCRTSLHRDHNAALNVLALGREVSGAGQAPPGVTVVGCHMRSLRIPLWGVSTLALLRADEVAADGGEIGQAPDDADGARMRGVTRHTLQRCFVDQVHQEHHVAVGGRFAVAVAYTLDTGNLAQQARRVQCRLLDNLAADLRPHPHNHFMPDHESRTAFRTLEKSRLDAVLDYL
jgi:putative transposase